MWHRGEEPVKLHHLEVPISSPQLGLGWPTHAILSCSSINSLAGQPERKLPLTPGSYGCFSDVFEIGSCYITPTVPPQCAAGSNARLRAFFFF